MDINVQIAIMSHLSDAQFLMRAYKFDDAERHINFAKLLTMKYENTNVYVSEDKLNQLWESLADRTV